MDTRRKQYSLGAVKIRRDVNAVTASVLYVHIDRTADMATYSVPIKQRFPTHRIRNRTHIVSFSAQTDHLTRDKSSQDNICRDGPGGQQLSKGLSKFFPAARRGEPLPEAPIKKRLIIRPRAVSFPCKSGCPLLQHFLFRFCGCCPVEHPLRAFFRRSRGLPYRRRRKPLIYTLFLLFRKKAARAVIERHGLLFWHPI